MNDATRKLHLAGALTAALLLSFTSPVTAVPITDGLLLWLDATDESTLFQDAALSTPALDGDPVGGWMDKSGNDFHATQFDDTLRPVRNDIAMNGFAALRFSAAESDGMLIDDTLFLERPYTVFVVN